MSWKRRATVTTCNLPGPLTAGLLCGRCRAQQYNFTKLSLPPTLGGKVSCFTCENSRSCCGGWLPELQGLVRCHASPMSQSRTEVQARICSLWAGWQVTRRYLLVGWGWRGVWKRLQGSGKTLQVVNLLASNEPFHAPPTPISASSL